MRRIQWVCKVCALCCLLACLPSLACTKVALLWPELQKTVEAAQPVLRWATTNDQPYRIQLSLQTPEQGIYFSSDVQASGGQWQLPAAVNSVLSVAKVIVSQGCTTSTAADLAAAPPTFFIDLRSSCSLMPDSLKLNGQRLEWQASTQANLFRLRVYKSNPSLTDLPTLAQSEELRSATWLLPRDFCHDQGRKVMTVQPICGIVSGRAQAIAACH